MTQVKIRPTTFTLFCNSIELPAPFRKFIESSMQNNFSLHGVPVRFAIKKAKGAEPVKSLLRHGKISNEDKIFNLKKKKAVRLGKQRTDPLKRWQSKNAAKSRSPKKKIMNGKR